MPRAAIAFLALTVFGALALAMAPATTASFPNAEAGVLAARPVNLVVTPAVRRALRAAFIRAHPAVRPARIKGPLRGSVYYARYGRYEWALATFSLPLVGTTDQPEVFRRRVGGRWVDLGDTGGSLCAVPRAVVSLWDLLSRYGYQC